MKKKPCGLSEYVFELNVMEFPDVLEMLFPAKRRPTNPLVAQCGDDDQTDSYFLYNVNCTMYD